MRPIAHRVRNSLRDSETEYRLSDDGLETLDADQTQTIPYEVIAEVHLKTYMIDVADPSEVHGQMTMRTKDGSRILIRSHHFLQLGSYESRAQTYGSLVRELCRRVGNANPSATFAVGSSRMRYVWMTTIAILVIGSIVMALALIMEGWRADLVFALALLAMVGPLALRSLRNSKQATFSPDAPPESMLAL